MGHFEDGATNAIAIANIDLRVSQALDVVSVRARNEVATVAASAITGYVTDPRSVTA